MKKKLSFEESFARVGEIAVRLEKQDVSLEESLKLYEEGVALIGAMEKTVEQAKLKVELLSQPEEE